MSLPPLRCQDLPDGGEGGLLLPGVLDGRYERKHIQGSWSIDASDQSGID